MNANQTTRDEEQMKFNSLNEVSSKFIDVANGDSQKYADSPVNGWSEHDLDDDEFHKYCVGGYSARYGSDL
jgi:hypothetical protein